MSVVRSSEVPLLGGSKCTSSMGKSIGGVRFVCCTEVVRFSESPLLEVLLYTTLNGVAYISCDTIMQIIGISS